jgi:transposase
MEYFAGLDVSMAETHVCVVTRNGAVIHQAKVPSTPADIAAELAQVPTCQRILFETGRMAPMLFHGLSQLGLPVVCVESRQLCQNSEKSTRLRWQTGLSGHIELKGLFREVANRD